MFAKNKGDEAYIKKNLRGIYAIANDTAITREDYILFQKIR